MTALSADRIERIVGPVDNPTRAQIVATGATEQELLEAVAWLGADDAMLAQRRPPPKGRVAELVAILEPPDGDEP